MGVPHDSRSAMLVNQVLGIVEAADACEDGVRQGADEVRLGDRVLPRGEAGLAEIDKFRDTMAAPAIAAIVLNLDRIATALETMGAPWERPSGDLSDFNDASLIAELARRAEARGPMT